MGGSISGTPLHERADWLDSWKEIASYLRRDVTTVQRWEKREGMPVHRHLHDRIGSVSASRAELDAWMRGRHLRVVQEEGNETAALPQPVVESPLRVHPRVRSGYVLAMIAVVAALVIGAGVWAVSSEFFWRNPMVDARFQSVTDSDGVEQAASVSSDGRFITFLSDRDGPMDIWVTQAGSGEFHNLTHGRFAELVNPSIRNLRFSPDGSLVTFWLRKPAGSSGDAIGTWAAPVLGGEPKPYLEDVAEYDWAPDGSRLAYHTPEPGDPLFVTSGSVRPDSRPIYTAPTGLHSHFPLWSPDMAYLYFVQGTLPDRLDIWRIHPDGGTPERITMHDSRVSHPVLLDRRTLLYLATDPDGSGPWLYSMDVEHRVAHRLSSGPDRYTSLAASGDGRQLVVTLARTKRTLWRLPLADAKNVVSAARQVALATGTGFSPRLGPNYLLYVSAAGSGDSIWKMANGSSVEIWHGVGAQISGGPAISPDGRSIAFSVRQHGKALLYVMQADGTRARMVTDALDLQGAPAWAPDGQSITSAANEGGLPHLLRVPLDGRPAASLVGEYSVDPVWAPDGRFVAYSGPDIGTTFSLKAATAEAAAHPLPALSLTRGARHVVFLPGGRALVYLRGGMEHKDLWMMDLESGVERPLTKFSAGFDIRDFDLSPDGREVVVERVQERSDVMLVALNRP